MPRSASFSHPRYPQPLLLAQYYWQPPMAGVHKGGSAGANARGFARKVLLPPHQAETALSMGRSPAVVVLPWEQQPVVGSTHLTQCRCC